jgi:NAD(P)-dependent dehydrogenase (short-subunit alcohol dehydrogenase family)
LSLISETINFAKEFVKKEKKLDCLINNAGVLLNKKSKTSEGFDAGFSTNILCKFILLKTSKLHFNRKLYSIIKGFRRCKSNSSFIRVKKKLYK